MKRILVLILVLSLSVTLWGCQSRAGNQPPSTPPASGEPGTSGSQGQSDPGENTPPADQSAASLGGLRLGMTASQLDSLLGQDYTEKLVDEGGHFREPFKIRSYGEDCQVVVGQTSGKVLQVDVYSALYPTNLEIKVGDLSRDALQKYRALYKEWVGNQSDQPLAGWFETEPGVLVIFSSMENHDRINQNLQPDSRITAITLGGAQYFD